MSTQYKNESCIDLLYIIVASTVTCGNQEQVIKTCLTFPQYWFQLCPQRQSRAMAPERQKIIFLYISVSIMLMFISKKANIIIV